MDSFERKQVEDFVSFIEREVLKVIADLATTGKADRSRLSAIAKSLLEKVNPSMDAKLILGHVVEFGREFAEAGMAVKNIVAYYEEKIDRQKVQSQLNKIREQ